MRIINKYNCKNEVVQTICQKAKYQKVILCLDDTSDMEFIDDICNTLKNVVLIKYYYNQNNIASFFNMVNSGARVVVYNVSLQHFYQLQNHNNCVLNIFIPQSEFVLPYMNTCESVYGDNLLVCDISKTDYISVIFLYEMALNNLWHNLLQGVEVDLNTFKGIDKVVDNHTTFYPDLLEQFNNLKHELTEEYKQIEEKQLPYYIYVRIYTILKMFENVYAGREQYIDFYKSYEKAEEIEKAYKLIVNCNIIETIKLNINNLIRIFNIILNRLKIVIKRKFNFKTIKLNKINNIIKMQSKLLNIDNLLYISHIFNSI